MSHDPLADLDDATLGEAVAVPPELRESDGEGEPVGDDTVLCLPESLTIAEVAECHAQWLERLPQVGEMVIDGRRVDQIDGAGLQLLTAFVKDREGDAVAVRWLGHSEALFNGARSLGLVAALGLNDGQESTQGGN